MDRYGGVVENINNVFLNIMYWSEKGSEIELLIGPIRDENTLGYLDLSTVNHMKRI